MSARDIAFALAGWRKPHRLPDGSHLVCCPVPSHGKGRGDRNPSLRLADGDTRLLVHCYGGCDHRVVLDELRRRGLLNGQHRVSLGTTAAHAEAQNGEREKRERADRERVRWAREISHAAHDPRGTLVEDYLHSRRLALDNALAGHVLRFHPRCPWRGEFLPALIAVF